MVGATGHVRYLKHDSHRAMFGELREFRATNVHRFLRLAAQALASPLLVLATSPAHADALTPEQTKKIAVDAYVYGYSLTTSDSTMKTFINTTAPNTSTLQAPRNQLVKVSKYPPAEYKGITAPNTDTLYTAGFMDVTKEPVLLSYPDMNCLYFLFPIYNQYTDVITAP